MDKSLDDNVKSKKSAGRARNRIWIGAGRKGILGINVRSSSFAIAKSSRRTKNFPLLHELCQESLAAVGLPCIESGTKLYISNLDHGVSNDDIRELFFEFGELKSYAVHFDKNGQPSGIAEVVYQKQSDAFTARKFYNNVQLDGRPMKIEIVSPNSGVPVSACVNVAGGANGKSNRRAVLRKGNGQTQSRGEGQQKRRRQGRGKKKPMENSVVVKLDNVVILGSLRY